MSDSMLDKIRSADNLPSLPTVAIQVLQLTGSETVTVADIASVIENDPALTSKLLKVANSSLFGMPRRICSVQQAMVILGLRTVKVMALTFSLLEGVRHSRASRFDYRTFWRRSLTSGVAARVLAQHGQAIQPDEAFVTALLSDIGLLAGFIVDANAYAAVLAECEATGEPLHIIEQKHFGVTHELFSSHLLDTWGLPERLVSTVGRHHREVSEIIAGEGRPDYLVRTVSAAVKISDVFCSPGGAARAAVVRDQIGRLLNISDSDLHEILRVLHHKVEEAAVIWSIDIGSVRSYKDLQEDAMAQMAKLTVAAELERAQLAVREQELNTRNLSLARKATTDGLTGLRNRIALEEHLQEIRRGHGPDARPCGMLLLDIDRFKKLNDTFGHQAGDAALRRVGQYLLSLDNERCFTARYGGEEFAVVVIDTTMDELSQLAEKIRLDLQQIRMAYQGRQIGVTASVGVAITHRSMDPPISETLIAEADKCLYQAKQTGRNRVVCAAPETART